MKYIRICDWDEFQHYKKRNPPWIKLHTSLLDNESFECLQNDSKVLLICLWLFASRKGNGEIPADLDYLKRKLPIGKKLKLQPLIDVGFIEVYQNDSTLQAYDDSKVLVLDRDRGETEIETEKNKYTDSFESFWKKFKGRWNAEKDKYIKVGKYPAFLEWEKLTLEDQRQAWSVADKVEGKYVPDACRWLKNRMFDDFEVRK